MITEAQYAAYLEELRARFPRLRVVNKAESPFCKALDVALRVVTGGGQSTFMTRYVTTIRSRIYVPSDWSGRPPAERYCVMRHEAVHLAQFRRYGLVGMTLIYVLLPVPLGFAAGRAWIEWQAYRETVVATWQVYGRDAARGSTLRAEILRRFTGPDYGWMWLRGRTIDGALERLLTQLETHPPPPLSSIEPTP
ncbi:MAG: hypothetical protein QF464_04870 [Myxococcota bacterium]|nr:hypothetical protein [Myxococcota bacterium]